MDAINQYLQERFEEVSPFEFYREIFPAGELDTEGAFTKGKYTGIVVTVTSERKPDGKVKIKRYSITDDLQTVNDVVASDDFCLCSPISYAGKNRTAENARNLYAIAVDLDFIRMKEDYPIGLANLLNRHVEALERIPRPTFIVSSGNGLHLYFVLERSIPLFKNIVEQLQDFKRELTRIIWHDSICNISHPKEVQQEGLYQGFRMPGTVTKNGGRARAYRTGNKATMEYLNRFVRPEYQVTRFAYKSSLSLKEAEEKYPDWYERRIVKGENRRAWAVNRAVYDWWLRRISEDASIGHRYFCMMALAIYARKCSRYDEKRNPNPVTREELEQDAFGLMPLFDSMTETNDNHFGADDVLDALEAFDDRWITCPRKTIEYRTAIRIDAKKRNYQKQADHLEEARAIRDIRARRNGERWDAHSGRKSKKSVVQEWRKENPDGKKADCIRETGLGKATVYRHWNV